MALIKCPECGKEISDKAPSCIHCGFPISEAGHMEKNQDEINPNLTLVKTEPPVTQTSTPSDAGSPSDQFSEDEKNYKKTKPKKFIAAIAIVVVATIALVVSIALKPNPFQQEIKEIFSYYGYTPNNIKVISGAEGRHRNVVLSISEDEIKEEDYDHLEKGINGVFAGDAKIKNVVVTILNQDQIPIDTLQIHLHSSPQSSTATGSGEGESPAENTKQNDSAPSEPDAVEKEKQEDESKKIWNRTENAVVSSLRSTLSAQTLYDHEFSLESYETGEGTLYSVTMDGYGTGVGYMWMTDTANGGKKPTVICENIYDSVNATAFSLASIALVKECGGYTLSTASSKFSTIYDSASTNGSSIDTTVDGTEYTLVIQSGTTLFTAQKP